MIHRSRKNKAEVARWASDVRGVARDPRVRPLSTHKKRRSSWTLQSKRLLSEERLILPPSVDITLLCSIRDLLLREAKKTMKKRLKTM